MNTAQFERERLKPFGLDIHPWLGTEHCLREKDGEEFQCSNDHTGCLWNDGHNTCMHDAPEHIVCPLRTKETKETKEKSEMSA